MFVFNRQVSYKKFEPAQNYKLSLSWLRPVQFYHQKENGRRGFSMQPQRFCPHQNLESLLRAARRFSSAAHWGIISNLQIDLSCSAAAPFELSRLRGRAKCNILINLEGYSFLKNFPPCTWNSLNKIGTSTALNFADPICSAWMVTEHSLKRVLWSFLQPCHLQLGYTLKNSPETDFLTFIQIQTLKTFKYFFFITM